MEQKSGYSYFTETEPSEWSLIGFLEWKSRTTHPMYRSKEHSAFKSFLQNIANDKKNTNAQRAQKLLDNWKVCIFIFVFFDTVGRPRVIIALVRSPSLLL